MKRICAGPNVIKGIDISHWEPHINFDSAVTAGIKFCILKCTEGLGYVDSTWVRRRTLCHNVGLITGFYHFFRPAQNAIKQAEFFCTQVGKLKPGELPLILDWESTDGVPGHTDVAAALSFCDVVEQHTGKAPIIYGSPYFLDAFKLSPAQVKRNPLWVAHYGTSCPLVPAAWANWTMWQNSESYNLDGVNVDSNQFNGTIEQLRALCS